MGLYNFQPRFVPFIIDGRKTHTIRAQRSNPSKPGDMLHLYTGLRTKKAKLLMRVLCVKVEEISIYEDHLGVRCVKVGSDFLRSDEKEFLAQRDGFKDFNDMMGFWDGRLPFVGHIIHWKFVQ
jgi:hypothetical protein